MRHNSTQTPSKSLANGGLSLLAPRSACRPRPPPFDPRRFRLETWLGAAILARGEAEEAPVRGSRSGAARAPLLWAVARALPEPERGAPHLRPHHGAVGGSGLHESGKGNCFSTVCGDDPNSD